MRSQNVKANSSNFGITHGMNLMKAIYKLSRSIVKAND